MNAERAEKIAASAARVSTKEELQEWERSANAILRKVAVEELSRRRDLRERIEDASRLSRNCGAGSQNA